MSLMGMKYVPAQNSDHNGNATATTPVKPTTKNDNDNTHTHTTMTCTMTYTSAVNSFVVAFSCISKGANTEVSDCHKTDTDGYSTTAWC